MNRNLINSILFVLIPLVPMLAVESVLREREQNYWFLGMAKTKQTADFVFVGTSRVRAAIREEEFAKDVSRSTGKQLTALNMGQGYTTPSEYLFGFQKVIAENPQALKNVTVFIEAPGSMSAFDTWTDDWMNPKQPGLLAHYIPEDRVVDYWMTDSSTGNKALLTLSHWFYTISYWQTIQQGVISVLDALIEHNGSKPSANGSSSLVAAGGIRTDAKGIDLVRQATLRDLDAQMRNQRSVQWDKTVMHSLVLYLKEHGATVYFFEQPLSPTAARPFSTSTRAADRNSFAQAVQSWRCPLLHPQFSVVGDDDFPDLLHMSKERSYQFTDSLAKSYVSTLSLPNPGSGACRDSISASRDAQRASCSRNLPAPKSK